MAKRSLIERTFEKGRGILRVAPHFVPRRLGGGLDCIALSLRRVEAGGRSDSGSRIGMNNK